MDDDRSRTMEGTMVRFGMGLGTIAFVLGWTLFSGCSSNDDPSIASNADGGSAANEADGSTSAVPDGTTSTPEDDGGSSNADADADAEGPTTFARTYDVTFVQVTEGTNPGGGSCRTFAGGVTFVVTVSSNGSSATFSLQDWTGQCTGTKEVTQLPAHLGGGTGERVQVGSGCILVKQGPSGPIALELTADWYLRTDGSLVGHSYFSAGGCSNELRSSTGQLRSGGDQ